jgi:hypothetical protein
VENFKQAGNHALAALLIGFFTDDKQSLHHATRPGWQIFRLKANPEAVVFQINETNFNCSLAACAFNFSIPRGRRKISP